MFYSQGSINLSKSTSQSLFMSGPHPNDRSRSTSLPSFNELLTSIPLTHDFTSYNRSTSSTSSSSASSSPNNYYTQPLYHMRMPNPSVSGSGHQAPSPSNASSHYQYNTYAPHLHPLPTSYAPPPHQVHPQPLVSHEPVREIPTLVRRSTSSPIPTARSNSSSPLEPGSPEVGEGMKEAKRKHVCKVCSRSFTTSGHLARHNRVHTGERKHVCPWPTCDARFARQDNCMQHYKTHTKGRNKRSKLSFKASV